MPVSSPPAFSPAVAPIVLGALGTVLTSTGPTTAPTFQPAAGGGAPANPTASVDLSAVNGVAATFMRSDAAPPLSQAITPTWTGTHTFSNALGFSILSATPRAAFIESDAALDEKAWDWALEAKTLQLRTRTDADGAGVNIFSILRGIGTAISNITVGNATNNPTFTFSGTGAVSIGGGVTVTSTGGVNAVRFTVTGATIPGAGIYLPGANRLGMATASTLRMEVDASGHLIPATTTTYNLGSATNQWNNVFIGGQVRFGNSTTGAQNATFVATNKPGTGAAGPIDWIPCLTSAGTQGYIPIFGA